MGKMTPWHTEGQFARSDTRQEVFWRRGNALFLQTGELDPKFWQLQVLNDLTDLKQGKMRYRFLDVRNGRLGFLTWTEGSMTLEEVSSPPMTVPVLTDQPERRCTVLLHEFDLRQRPVILFGNEELGVYVYGSDSIHGACDRNGVPLWVSRLFLVDLNKGSISELPFSELALGQEYLSQSRFGSFYLFGPRRPHTGLWKKPDGEHRSFEVLDLVAFQVEHHERTGALISLVRAS